MLDFLVPNKSLPPSVSIQQLKNMCREFQKITKIYELIPICVKTGQKQNHVNIMLFQCTLKFTRNSLNIYKRGTFFQQNVHKRMTHILNVFCLSHVTGLPR